MWLCCTWFDIVAGALGANQATPPRRRLFRSHYEQRRRELREVRRQLQQLAQRAERLDPADCDGYCH